MTVGSVQLHSPNLAARFAGLTCGLLRTWAAYERLGLAPQHLISTEPLPVARLKRPSAAQAVWPRILAMEGSEKMAIFFHGSSGEVII